MSSFELSFGEEYHFSDVRFPTLDELRRLALARLETATTKTEDLYYTRYAKGFLEDSILTSIALNDQKSLEYWAYQYVLYLMGKRW